MLAFDIRRLGIFFGCASPSRASSFAFTQSTDLYPALIVVITRRGLSFGILYKLWKEKEWKWRGGLAIPQDQGERTAWCGLVFSSFFFVSGAFGRGKG